MKIQYVSDLHLEYHDEIIKLPVTAEYLALAGDIGYPSKANYGKFIEWCSDNYKCIFLIIGNHEYYHENDMNTTKDKIVEIVSNFSNVYLLDNNKIEIEGWIVLGTTLWSHIPDIVNIDRYINDYKYINIYGMVIDSGVTNRLFESNVEWLTKEIRDADANNKKVIVISHHAPLQKGTSDPVYESTEREINYAFSSDLAVLMREPVKLWIFGHTHWTCDFIHNNVRVVTNGIGYKNERECDLGKYVDV